MIINIYFIFERKFNYYFSKNTCFDWEIILILQISQLYSAKAFSSSPPFIFLHLQLSVTSFEPFSDMFLLDFLFCSKTPLADPVWNSLSLISHDAHTLFPLVNVLFSPRDSCRLIEQLNSLRRYFIDV